MGVFIVYFFFFFFSLYSTQKKNGHAAKHRNTPMQLRFSVFVLVFAMHGFVFVVIDVCVRAPLDRFYNERQFQQFINQMKLNMNLIIGAFIIIVVYIDLMCKSNLCV